MSIDSQSSVPAKAAQDQLDRILKSAGFSRSARMRRFLRYVVEQSLAKSGAQIKEYAVALEVYDKSASFDPRIDPIIRVEASRLRAKLREYYAEQGRGDSIVIAIRKGGYSAVVRKKRAGLAEPRLMAAAEPRAAHDPEARHLYLMGRHYWNKRNATSVLHAMDCFNKAIEIEPAYAASHAGLADCLAAQAWFEMRAPGPCWAAAAKEIELALDTDAILSGPLATRAFKKAAFDWDWTGAEEGFRQAIAANPRYATARDWYGIYCLAPQRRLSAAAEEVMRACAMDPLSPIIGTHLGTILYLRRRYNEAAAQFQRAVELDPAFHLAYWRLAFAFIEMSRFDEARQALKQALTLGREEPSYRWATAYLHARRGDRKQAERLLGTLTETTSSGYASPVGIAMVYSALKQSDPAFRYLDRALKERACRLIHLRVEPGFDPLKTDPRFVGILKILDLL